MSSTPSNRWRNDFLSLHPSTTTVRVCVCAFPSGARPLIPSRRPTAGNHGRRPKHGTRERHRGPEEGTQLIIATFRIYCSYLSTHASNFPLSSFLFSSSLLIFCLSAAYRCAWMPLPLTCTTSMPSKFVSSKANVRCSRGTFVRSHKHTHARV